MKGLKIKLFFKNFSE